MSELHIFVMVGIYSVAVGCGSGKAANGTGGSGSGGIASGSSGGHATGGATGASSGSGGSGASGDGGCVLPSCLENLAPKCVGTGTCATMTNLNTDDYNTCFPNGVVESAVIDQTSNETTLTVKQANVTCFSTTFNYNEAWSGTGSITVADASGKTVASVRMNAMDNLRNLVTCAGAQEVSLDLSCSNVWPVSALTGSKCDEGGCSP